MAGPSSLLVVLTPDGFGQALLETDAAGVLLAWRDQRIRLVADRALIVRYLRMMRRLDLSERLLRWWGWWLGSADKTCLVPDAPAALAGAEHYHYLAGAASAPFIVHWPGWQPAATATGGSADIRWVTIRELLLMVTKGANQTGALLDPPGGEPDPTLPASGVFAP